MTLPALSAPAPASAVALPPREYWFSLPALRTSVRAARDAVRDRLCAWDVAGDTCCDAVLMISELTTNAILHSGSGHFLCGVTLSGDQRCLRIEVHDDGHTPLDPPVQHTALEAEGGRGLLLVRQLADRWGSTYSTRSEGKVVWAELAAYP